MDIMLYFMKLEDKYWGLFLAALFLLYIFLFVQKKENGRWLVLYGFLTYLVFICPLTYRLFADYGGMEKTYYKVSHIELVVPVLCLALTLAWQKIRGYRKKILPLFTLGMVLLFVFSGTLVYTQAGSRMPVQGCYREQEKEAYDLMLADAGDADAVTFWGPSELMAKSRIYSGRLQPIYGKDIAASPDAYSGELQTLYQGYSSYEAKDSLLINKDEQLGAIANCLHLYPQIDCRYVVVYDPKQQGTDFDAEEIFTSLGYRFVGQTGELMLFSLQ